MAHGWFGQQIPVRLRTWPTADELARMARHPSAYGPTAAEVLASDACPPSPQSLADLGARDIEHRDGVVVGLSLAGRSFVAHSDALFALAPQLETVRFVAVRHLLAELVRCANLERLQRIDLSGNRIGSDGARLLAACPHFAHLQSLNLSANSLTDAGVDTLAAAPWADSIRELRLSASELSVDGELVARSRFENRLRLT